MDHCVCVGVSSCASVENHSRVVLFGLVGTVCDIGSELTGNETLVDPEGTDSGTLHQGILGHHDRSNLVGPVDFVDPMVIGQSQQNLIVQIVRVHSQLMVPAAGSVPSFNDNVLAWSQIKANHTSMVIQNVNISQVNLKIRDRESILMKVRPVHDLDGPWLVRVVDKHDFNVSVHALFLVDGISKVSSHQVLLPVFNVVENLSSGHPRVSYEHVILDLFWDHLL